MGILSWNEKFDTPVRVLEKKNRDIVSIVNDFHEAMKRGIGKSVMKTLLEVLAEYSMAHFFNEETLMRNLDYPEYQQHKKEHITFVMTVKKFQRAQNLGRLSSIDIKKFLNQWVDEHVLESDKRFEGYLDAQGGPSRFPDPDEL